MRMGEVRLAVLYRDGAVCACCGCWGDTIDHILSRAERRRQGISAYDDRYIVVACKRDNLRKGTRRLIPPSWAHRQAELEELTNKQWQVWAGDPRELGAERILI